MVFYSTMVQVLWYAQMSYGAKLAFIFFDNLVAEKLQISDTQPGTLLPDITAHMCCVSIHLMNVSPILSLLCFVSTNSCLTFFTN